MKADQKGLLLRARGGFFDVQTQEGIVRCRARGHLHLDGTEPIPGDWVYWEKDPAHQESGILKEVEPRKNSFIRPNVANIDQLIFVASAARPETDPYLIDQMSIVAEKSACTFILCLNKIDLNPAHQLTDLYKSCGFQVIRTSATSGEGIDELCRQLQGQVSAVTGNSGVGKSSLLNLLIPGLNSETAQISPKHGRGRHTTRHTELFPLPQAGWIADTPGFASLDLSMLCEINRASLGLCFPEFPVNRCRFHDCIHHNEPDCAVRDAVRNHLIPMSRYQSYLRLLKECK